jgi:dienelactone hydrolase
MSYSSCCFKGFKWEGTPAGRTDKVANLDTYITGDNSHAAVLIIHDVFGWTFPNIRLLADHIAKETDVTAFVPDFFGGEVLDFEMCRQERYEEIGLDELSTEVIAPPALSSSCLLETPIRPSPIA